MVSFLHRVFGSKPDEDRRAFAADIRAFDSNLHDSFHFELNLFMNSLLAAGRIRRRISFLPDHRVCRIMSVITEGYLLPQVVSAPLPQIWEQSRPRPPQRCGLEGSGEGHDARCRRTLYLRHDGKPSIVSPVHTSPKGLRSKDRHFVVNMSYINGFIAAPYSLETTIC